MNNVTELPVSASTIAMSCRSRAAGAYADQPQSARSLHQRCPDVTRSRMAGSRGICASDARRADDRWRLPVIGAVVPVGTSSAGMALWRLFQIIRRLLESGHCPLIGNHRLSISKSW